MSSSNMLNYLLCDVLIFVSPKTNQMQVDELKKPKNKTPKASV